MSSVFGDDGGFWAGHALSERANTKQKLILADALRQERDEKDAIISDQNNQKAIQINELRCSNLLTLAEFEYDIHAKVDVSYRLRIASTKLNQFADNTDNQPMSELRELAEALMDARNIHLRKDKDDWIINRWNQLMKQCSFAKNDQEAQMAGGYGMPFPGSIPPFAEANLDAISRGEEPNIYTVLSDPECIPEIMSKINKGPMKF